MSDKMVGIVTFNDAYNYGAFLQEYALQTYLIKSGYRTEVINYENPFFSQQYLYSTNVVRKKGIKNKLKIIYNFIFRHQLFLDRKAQKNNFMRAIEKEIKLSPPFSYSNKKWFNDTYDCFIAGSDQIWNVLVTNHDKFYFLDFVDNQTKKKTYAASLGRSSFDKPVLDEIISNIQGFNDILIREESGKVLLAQAGIKSSVVLDPTFLLEKRDWLEFSKKSKVKVPEKYILIYIVAAPTNLLDVAISYADENGCDIIAWGGQNRDIIHKGRRIKTIVSAGPYDFVKYIANAHKIFTTSFHGMALAINLNVEFYYELCRAKYNNNARLETIAEKLELFDREITDDGIVNTRVDWEKTNKILEKLRVESRARLFDSIESSWQKQD